MSIWKWITLVLVLVSAAYSFVVWDNMDSIRLLTSENIIQHGINRKINEIFVSNGEIDQHFQTALRLMEEKYQRQMSQLKNKFVSSDLAVASLVDENVFQVNHLELMICTVDREVERLRDAMYLTDEVKYAMDRVFRVVYPKRRYNRYVAVSGSCVLIDKKKGIFLTAGHMVWDMPTNGTSFLFGNVPGEYIAVKDTISALKDAMDLALIFVDPDQLARLDWEELTIRGHDLVPGELIISVGYAFGNHKPHCTMGIAGNFDKIRNPHGVNLEATILDTTVIGGMSGGPVVDRDGFVVGIHSFGVTGSWHALQSVEQIQNAIQDMVRTYEVNYLFDAVGVSN